MKRRKFIALFLSILMLLQMTSPVFAETESFETVSAEAAIEAADFVEAAEAAEAIEDEETNEGKQMEETANAAVLSDSGVIKVDYYCSIGAYLVTLQEEVDKWNAKEGKEKGVYLNLISNINTYSTDLQTQLDSGKHYDIMDVNTSHQDWIEKGWVMDLRTIDNADLKALIKSYEPYIQKGINIQADHLHALPSEVVPIKMAVNTDLFKKNGLELPKTWDDVYKCAKVITENGGGKEFGYGATTWLSLWSRLTFKASMNSTGRGWWDPNTETYDWSQFKVPAETIKKMYQDGYTFGMDDLAIDPIRALFAEGKIGMFPAPSYDYAVYTNQFPAECNWTVIDMPTIEAGEAPYKGVYLDRTGCSIDKVAYNAADAEKKKAIEEAFIFLNSDYLNGRIYEIGGMIPYKLEVIEAANPEPYLGPQWIEFGDIEEYASMSLFPDSLIPLEGDKANVCFREWCHTPEMSFETVAKDVADRYNAAYQELKAFGSIDLSPYVYEYDITRGGGKTRYMVTFDTNGHGDDVLPQKKTAGKLINRVVLTEEGFDFGGWFVDEELTTEWNFAEDVMPERDITLYAKWTENKNLYTLNFDVCGKGTAPASQKLKVSARIFAPEVGIVDGYIVEGWYREKEYSNKWNFSSDVMPASNLTLYAKWVVKPNVNEVTYYCSIGAYLITLQEEIDKWNAGEGKEKGVYLNLISNINTYSTDLQRQLDSGKHYDIMDVNTSHQDWIEKGWVMDLRTIDNADLKALIKSYEPYIQKGINIQADHLHALPSEVVPIKMAVNTDLFKKNGLELPKTWDDVYKCAKVITENGGGKEFGYGGTTWGSLWSRLTFKASMNSTGRGWWDPNTETYDWSQFKVPAETIKKMYQDGYTLGMDDLAIDPIRALFAEGKIGMFPAPSYDYAVYTNQFPAECNWTVIDMPTIEAGEAPYKGVYLDRTGCSIDKVAYNAADAEKKKAIEEAFIFLNSDYLNGRIYETGGMIPYKPEVIANAHVESYIGPQWKLFGLIKNYTSMSLFPDSLIPLEGDKANVCFQEWCHAPEMSFETAAKDVADRYNAAYKKLKADGDVDLSAYKYKYDIKRNSSADTEKTVEELINIDPEGKTQEEIAAEVQKKISTEKLKKAMLAEEGALTEIERLEEATHVETVTDVKEKIKGLNTTDIAVRGAALNKLTDSNKDIVLEVRKAAKEHTIPSQYKPEVSVQFSMNLKNVADPENLKVPVLIDMLVPAGINVKMAIILHFFENGGQEAIAPVVYTGSDGKPHAKFALTRFSDFVFTEVKPTPEPTPTPSSGGGGGGGTVTSSKATFSKKWYVDAAGIWKIKNKSGEDVKNAWLCDDAIAANGQNVWYLLGNDGAMVTAGLVQDNTGNYYSLEMNHNGYYGMLRYKNGTYDGIYMEFSQKHDGTFGAITNQSAIDALKAKYGVAKFGIGNDRCVYTKSFE